MSNKLLRLLSIAVLFIVYTKNMEIWMWHKARKEEGQLLDLAAVLTVLTWGGLEGFMAADEAENVFADSLY